MKDHIRYMMYVFKTTGKYYNNEEIEIPTTIPPSKIEEAFNYGAITDTYKGMVKVLICIEPDQDNMSREELAYTVPLMIKPIDI